MPSQHRIKLDTFHYKWSKSHRPAISIRAGDTVTFEINDVGSWQITNEWESEDLNNFDGSKLYPLAGPVYIEGAKRGDALAIDVLDVKVGDLDGRRFFRDSEHWRNSRSPSFTNGICETRNSPISARESGYPYDPFVVF
ncbi:MAG: acetamidase/formamidase family protein [Thaumarchaeota archaeon]|nr:acetamidase/formamidase family protein [Nitrososphaerota archaeon]